MRNNKKADFYGLLNFIKNSFTMEMLAYTEFPP